MKHKEYEAVLKEWIQEGVVDDVKDIRNNESEHNLRYRVVIKENATTRVRLLFDGSTKENDPNSINDYLKKGPNIRRTHSSHLQ